MNKKVRALLIVTLVTCIVFLIAAIASFFFGLIWTVINKDYDSILSLGYTFFHGIIVFVGIYFAKKSLRDGSLIMRTIMYKNDYQELTPSRLAKGIAIGLGVVGLFIGSYFACSYIFAGVNAPYWNMPMMFRVMMINVCLFVFFMSLYCLIFPYIYDINIDIAERKKAKDTLRAKQKQKELEELNNADEGSSDE